MGEYAVSKAGVEFKVGTCESAWGLRLEHAPEVTPRTYSVDPVRRANALLFRFPFPDEDGKQPGEYGQEDWNRSYPAWGATVPEGVEHSSIQLVRSYPRQGGYNVSLPCPNSAEGKAATAYKMHANGAGAEVRITAQRIWNGHVAVVAECGGCGAAYRYPELSDAADLLAALETAAANVDRPSPQRDERQAAYLRTMAERIREGYTNPPAWVTDLFPATVDA